MSPRPSPETALSPGLLRALAEEAAQKSDVCWLSYLAAEGAVTDRLVWHAVHQGSLVILAGEPGQELPGLSTATRAVVTFRSSTTKGRLVSWEASVTRVQATDPEWAAAAAALAAARLNLIDPPAAVQRWARECSVVLLNLPEHLPPGH